MLTLFKNRRALYNKSSLNIKFAKLLPKTTGEKGFEPLTDSFGYYYSNI